MTDSRDEPKRMMTIFASDPHPGRVDRARMGRRNPADTEPYPATSLGDAAATRAELAELRRRMNPPDGLSGGAMARPSRPRPPKADLTELLIASMEEAVRIIAGEQPPARVHTAAELAARSAGKRQEAHDAPGRLEPAHRVARDDQA